MQKPVSEGIGVAYEISVFQKMKKYLVGKSVSVQWRFSNMPLLLATSNPVRTVPIKSD